MKSEIKICAISDMHGQYTFDIELCNLLFICGDIVPLKMQNNIPQSLKWFKKEFIDWCNKIDCDEIILVGGNHDFFMEKSSTTIKEILQSTNITYLFNENYEYIDKNFMKWNIFGTPLCHQFGNWAFMHSDDYNKSYYKIMKDNTDIVISHDMPYGMNDMLLQNLPWVNNTEHLGNIPLREVIDQKKPKYVFGGHLHSCDHNIVDYNGIKCANVSLLDEEYIMSYKPLYLTIDKNNGN